MLYKLGVFNRVFFAEIICVKADLQMRIPEYISFEYASALGVGVLTVGRAFYDKFGLPYPSTSDEGTVDTASWLRRQILIYGGSSMMGAMYIQYAKL